MSKYRVIADKYQSLASIAATPKVQDESIEAHTSIENVIRTDRPSRNARRANPAYQSTDFSVRPKQVGLESSVHLEDSMAMNKSELGSEYVPRKRKFVPATLIKHDKMAFNMPS